MKKIITLILGLCLCFALMGCGGGNDSSSSNESFEEGSNAAAYYKDGNLYIPIPKRHNNYTVRSDKYIWSVKCFTGVVRHYPEWVKLITLLYKDGVVTVPEKYANEKYVIIARCKDKYIRGKFYIIEIKQNQIQNNKDYMTFD